MAVGLPLGREEYISFKNVTVDGDFEKKPSKRDFFFPPSICTCYHPASSLQSLTHSGIKCAFITLKKTSQRCVSIPSPNEDSVGQKQEMWGHAVDPLFLISDL